MLVIESWNGNDINDGTNYKAGFSPALEWGLPIVEARRIGRVGNWPVINGIDRAEGAELEFYIAVVDSDNLRTLVTQLKQWFDPDDDEVKRLIIADDTSSTHQRYKEGICTTFEPFLIGGLAARGLFRVVIAVDGDVKWRSVTEQTDTWNVTASGQSNSITNGGDAPAFPVFTFKPTSVGTGLAYRRWVPIIWRSENAGPDYPCVFQLDTASLVTASKMQSDGDDLRVFVNGVETNRWLVDMNTASTDIWVTESFTRAPNLQLETAIPSSGDIDSIEFTDEVEVALLPEEGIIYIDSEAFVYTERTLVNASVSGITRGAKGTSEAAHTVGTTCHWIQHDVWIAYGNASLSAPTVDDTYKPVFELDSSDNTSWRYEEFGNQQPGREGRAEWSGYKPITLNGNIGRYILSQRGSSASPTQDYEVLGSRIEGDFDPSNFHCGWYLDHPCGIVNAMWAAGYIRETEDQTHNAKLYTYPRAASWYATLRRWDTSGAALDTWVAWSESRAASDFEAADRIGLGIWRRGMDFEVGTVEIDLKSDEVPLATVGSEQGNYELDCTLYNDTTGESFTLRMVMDLDSELEVDTVNKTVTWKKDGSNQFKAISFSTRRNKWLKLTQGANSLRFVDSGTGNVTITTTFRVRRR